VVVVLETLLEDLGGLAVKMEILVMAEILHLQVMEELEGVWVYFQFQEVLEDLEGVMVQQEVKVQAPATLEVQVQVDVLVVPLVHVS
jgi:hypothetical protein